jgi:hypothetical protein
MAFQILESSGSTLQTQHTLVRVKISPSDTHQKPGQPYTILKDSLVLPFPILKQYNVDVDLHEFMITTSFQSWFKLNEFALNFLNSL